MKIPIERLEVVDVCHSLLHALALAFECQEINESEFLKCVALLTDLESILKYKEPPNDTL